VPFFLGAIFAAVFGSRFFLTADFRARLPAWRNLDFAFFGVVRFATILRAGLVLVLPRFELFLLFATRFFALAMVAAYRLCRSSSS
jgi:hypothetical protein